MKKIVHILVFLLLSFQATAQVFPVQLTPQTIPPNPVYIADYANPNTTLDKVRLQILLNDITSNNREIRLKVYIEGQGILAQSNDLVIGAQPLFIDGGIPIQLGSADLAPYFEFQNLQGINPNTYGSALPEGVYNFCFEVYDTFTGNRLSQKTCTSFILFQNEPPFLNLPYNESVIQEQNPLNIVFQWTPRHVNVSNVQYEFSLVEIWDNYVDPQAAFLATPPIFQTTTTQTTLIYGPAFPQLLTGKRYAWRVRAFAQSGAEEIGVFTNQGNSEIFWFAYQTQCNAPTFVNAEEIGDRHAKITWQGEVSHLDYTIKYREKNAGSDWYDLTTAREYITVNDLNRETTYEYKILGNCDFGSFGETMIYEFTTLSEEASAYIGCNIEPDPADLSNQTLLTELFANDVFTAGDFPVTALVIDDGIAPFSGSGYVKIPWLGDTKIAVHFNTIDINTDMKLVAGEVKTTYDPDWGDVDDLNDWSDILDEVFGDSSDEDDTGDSSDDDSGDNTGDGTDQSDNSDNNEDENTDGNNSEDDQGNDDDGNNDSGDNTNDNTNNDSTGDDNTGNDDSDNNNEEEVYIEYDLGRYDFSHTIEIPYVRGEMEKVFNLRGISSSETVIWDLYPSIDNYSQLREFPENGDNVTFNVYDELPAEYVLSAIYGDAQNIRVKIKIIEREFDLVELYGKHRTERIAKSGERLYLLNPVTLSEAYKKVNYGIKISPNIAEIKINPNNIDWYDASGGENVSLGNQGKRVISRNLKETNELITTKVAAGFKDKIEKSVYVDWIDSYDNNTDIFSKFNKVITFLQEFNKFSRKFGTILPCEFTALTNFDALKQQQKASFNIRLYNKEDTNSREIFDIIQTTLKLKGAELAKLKCTKSIGIGPISLGNAYVSMDLKSSLDFAYKLKTTNETSRQVTEPSIAGGLSLTLKGGLETNPAIDEYAYATANLNIAAGTKTIWPYQGDDGKIASYFYLGNTNLTVEGYVDGWLVGGYQPFNFNHVLFNSYWESETKLIIDIKNGEINLE